MSVTAVHLCERVLPALPIRQWVCSLPWRLRFLWIHDRERSTGVLTAFVAELSRSLRVRAERVVGLASVTEAHTGVATLVQRFDSGLGLDVHLRSRAMDGVYVREGAYGRSCFMRCPSPRTTRSPSSLVAWPCCVAAWWFESQHRAAGGPCGKRRAAPLGSNDTGASGLMR